MFNVGVEHRILSCLLAWMLFEGHLWNQPCAELLAKHLASCHFIFAAVLKLQLCCFAVTVNYVFVLSVYSYTMYTSPCCDIASFFYYFFFYGAMTIVIWCFEHSKETKVMGIVIRALLS